MEIGCRMDRRVRRQIIEAPFTYRRRVGLSMKQNTLGTWGQTCLRSLAQPMLRTPTVVEMTGRMLEWGNEHRDAKGPPPWWGPFHDPRGSGVITQPSVTPSSSSTGPRRSARVR